MPAKTPSTQYKAQARPEPALFGPDPALHNFKKRTESLFEDVAWINLKIFLLEIGEAF
jgi:hypothetical protein